MLIKIGWLISHPIFFELNIKILAPCFYINFIFYFPVTIRGTRQNYGHNPHYLKTIATG